MNSDVRRDFACLKANEASAADKVTAVEAEAMGKEQGKNIDKDGEKSVSKLKKPKSPSLCKQAQETKTSVIVKRTVHIWKIELVYYFIRDIIFHLLCFVCLIAQFEIHVCVVKLILFSKASSL